MRLSVTTIVILISTYIVNASVLDPVIENVVHLTATKPPNDVSGIWKKKTIWKPRWIKEWKSAKVMKPVWRKIWGPVQIKEWVPIPKPPPGWNSISTKLVHVKTAPKGKTLLWDPVPYPESQQPPPPSAQSFLHTDTSCGPSGCVEAFNDQQIAGIIGGNYKNTPDYHQSAEYSESVTHLTRVPPNDNWRQFPQSGNLQLDNRFNFPELSQFLVPPRFQFQSDNLQFRNQNEQEKLQQPFNFQTKSNPNTHLSSFPQLEIKQNNNDQRQWTPLPPSNNVKGHFITTSPSQPYRFQSPESSMLGQLKNATSNHNVQKEVKPDGELSGKPGFNTHSVSNNLRTQVGTDFIQEAQLVGEYHYSEFDAIKNIKPEENTNFKEMETGNKEEILRPSIPLAENRKPIIPQVSLQNPPKGEFPSSELKKNPRPVEDTKPRQVRKDGKPTQELSLVQNKSQANLNLSRPRNNFEQERAAALEIFPIYRTTSSPISISKNHRFAPQRESSKPFLPNLNSNSSLNIITSKEFQSQSSHKPEDSLTLQPIPPKPLQEPLTAVEIPPEFVDKINYLSQNTTQNPQKTSLETTTPFYVFSTSSFTTTTEPRTISPVFVVTPASTGKS